MEQKESSSRATPTVSASASPSPKFALGQLVATPGAIEAMTLAGTNALPLVARHSAGDWGDVDAEDRAANDRAVENGERILSAYTLSDGTRVWIITESDRSVTTVLLPDEY